MIDPVLLGNIVGALVTIMGFSFLYRQNMFYRIMEHIFVGIALGYSLSIAAGNIERIGLTPLAKGSYDLVIPIFLGILLFAGLSKRHSRVRAISTAVLAGIGTGLVLRGIVGGQIIGQIVGLAALTRGDLRTVFGGAVVFVATFTTLTYFLFTRPTGGIMAAIQRPLGRINQIGRYFIMVGLGATLGSTVLSNSSFIVERIQFLLLTRSLEYVVFPAVVISAILIWRDIGQTRKKK